MNALRRLVETLRTRDWGRGLKRLAIVVGVSLAIYWTALSLVSAGMACGLYQTGHILVQADALGCTSGDASAVLAYWSRGWAVLLFAPLITAMFWVAAGSAPGNKDFGWRRPRARQIRTERLVLRRPLWDDLPAILAICSDAETLRYWDRKPYQSPEEIEPWMQRLCETGVETRDIFVIEREGRVIGLAGSVTLPWVTYLLAREEWGHGYAAEAIAAFTGYMAGRGMLELHAATHPDNAPSLALLKRSGFVEYGRSTGLFNIQGEPGDAVHFRWTPADPDASADPAERVGEADPG